MSSNNNTKISGAMSLAAQFGIALPSDNSNKMLDLYNNPNKYIIKFDMFLKIIIID